MHKWSESRAVYQYDNYQNDTLKALLVDHGVVTQHDVTYGVMKIPRGNVTGATFAFPTLVTTPRPNTGEAVQTAGSQYDFVTGLLTGFKDRNGISQTIYDDPFNRPTLVKEALGLAQSSQKVRRRFVARTRAQAIKAESVIQNKLFENKYKIEKRPEVRFDKFVKDHFLPYSELHKRTYPDDVLAATCFTRLLGE